MVLSDGNFLEAMSFADWLFVGVLDAFAFLYCYHIGRESVPDPPSKPPRSSGQPPFHR